MRMTLRLIWICSVFLGLATCAEAQQVFGLGGFRPASVNHQDITGARYKFEIVSNAIDLKIIFGFNRFYTPGAPLTYLIEANVYTGSYSNYESGSCTVWPLIGDYTRTRASLRVAVPDYNYHFGETEGLATGIRTEDDELFPIQTYSIDNISNLWKSDAISQADIENTQVQVTIERGEVIADVSEYTRCGLPIVQQAYREWHITSEWGDPVQSAQQTIILPDENGGRYLTWYEFMNFASEFLNFDGIFTVQFWDHELKRESTGQWEPVRQFRINTNYDGNGSDFGVRRVVVADHVRAEFSNVPGNEYLAVDTTFWLGQLDEIGSVLPALGGLWYDPAYAGSGFNFVETAVGTFVYFYGYTPDGERLWLVSAAPISGRITTEQPVSVDMLVGDGGTLALPTRPEGLRTWGRMEMIASSCDEGEIVLERADGERITYQARLLIQTRGVACALPN